MENSVNSNVTINGKSYYAPSGSTIFVSNNEIRIGGDVISSGTQKSPVVVKVEGCLVNLQSAGDVEVSGSVGENINAEGSVKCGQVGGDVKTNGTVTCGDVSGDVKTNGSVKVSGSVGGKVVTNGHVSIGDNK